ncbi:MAG: hypothetical protein U0837_00640 [Dehalococcoidia bacterium]
MHHAAAARETRPVVISTARVEPPATAARRQSRTWAALTAAVSA